MAKKLVMPGITEGDWFVANYGDDDAPVLAIHSSDENRVCFMATPGSNGDPSIIEADALFLASSKGMAEAAIRYLAENSKYDFAETKKAEEELHAALIAAGCREES